MHRYHRYRLRDNTARQKLHETERLDSDVRDHENAARQELHGVPDVRDHENAVRQELHETERLERIIDAHCPPLSLRRDIFSVDQPLSCKFQTNHASLCRRILLSVRRQWAQPLIQAMISLR
jgi:hypothetical protein